MDSRTRTVCAFYLCRRQGRIQGFRKGGGGQKIEMTVHVMVPFTGRMRRLGGGGGFGGDVPPIQLDFFLK